jgi:hypothetical protein
MRGHARPSTGMVCTCCTPRVRVWGFLFEFALHCVNLLCGVCVRLDLVLFPADGPFLPSLSVNLFLQSLQSGTRETSNSMGAERRRAEAKRKRARATRDMHTETGETQSSTGARRACRTRKNEATTSLGRKLTYFIYTFEISYATTTVWRRW